MLLFKKQTVGNDQGKNTQTVVQTVFRTFRKSSEPDLDYIGTELAKTPRIELKHTYSGGEKPQMVPMGYAVITDIGYPIGTDGLISCVALIIMDRDCGRHSVVHITPLTEVKPLLHWVKQFKGDNVSGFLCEGPLDYGVLERIYSVLSQSELNSLEILQPVTGLIIQNENIYRIAPEQMVERNRWDCELI